MYFGTIVNSSPLYCWSNGWWNLYCEPNFYAFTKLYVLESCITDNITGLWVKENLCIEPECINTLVFIFFFIILWLFYSLKCLHIFEQELILLLFFSFILRVSSWLWTYSMLFLILIFRQGYLLYHFCLVYMETNKNWIIKFIENNGNLKCFYLQNIFSSHLQSDTFAWNYRWCVWRLS